MLRPMPDEDGGRSAAFHFGRLLRSAGRDLAAGLGLVSRRRRLRRQALRAPLLQVRDLRDGLAAVRGEAICLDGAVPPWGGPEVVASRLVVAALVDAMRREPPTWVPLLDVSTARDLWVRDATGRVRVEGWDALLLLEAIEARSCTGERAPAWLVDFARGRVEPWRDSDRLVWRTYALLPGAEVTACGDVRFRLEPDQEAAGYRGSPMRPVFAATTKTPLLLSDRELPDLVAALGPFADLPPERE